MPTIGGMEVLGWTDPNVSNFESLNIVTIYVAGIHIRVNKEVAPIFKQFIMELALIDSNIPKVKDDWGYANRNIRGAVSKSYHAWGLAIDLDATTNPMGVRKTNFPATATRSLCHKYGLRWGFDYVGRPDPMHFEFIGSLAQARHIVSTLK